MVASRRHRGGVGDLLAIHRNGARWLIECKTTKRGPWADYGPAKRKEALEVARRNKLSVWLIWRPPGGSTRWIPGDCWPEEGRKNGTGTNTHRS